MAYKQGEIEAIIWATWGLAFISVVLRLVSRGALRGKSGLDDAFASFALLVNLVFTCLTQVSVSAGYGTPASTLSESQVSTVMKHVIAQNSVACETIAWPKLAVVALLVRVFEPRRGVVILFYGLTAILIAYSFAISVLWWEQCSPVSKNWDRKAPGTCLPMNIVTDVSIGQSSLSAFLDIFFAAYPGTILWRLQMPKWRKVMLMLNMGLGGFAGGIAIYKTTQLETLASAKDPTYGTYPAITWTAIEANALIIAACVPTWTPLFTKARTALTEKSKGLYSYGDSSGDEEKDRTVANDNVAASLHSFWRGKSSTTDAEGSMEGQDKVPDLPTKDTYRDTLTAPLQPHNTSSAPQKPTYPASDKTLEADTPYLRDSMIAGDRPPTRERPLTGDRTLAESLHLQDPAQWPLPRS